MFQSVPCEDPEGPLLNLTKISIDDKPIWDEALSPYPHSFFHTSDCIAALQLTHPYPTHLYKFQGESGSAIVPLQSRSLQGQYDLLTPFGYSGMSFKNYSDPLLDQVLSLLEEDGAVCSYITNHPLFSDELLLQRKDYYQNNVSYVNDLTLSEDELYKNLIGRKRSQIKLKDSSEFIYDKTLLLDPFIELYLSSMKKMGVSSFYLFSPETLKALVKSKDTLLIGVKNENNILATTLIGLTPYIGDFLLNGASEEGRKYSSALLWRAMMLTKEKGIPHFNFGGGMSQGDGLAKFKSLFGGKELPFGALKLIHQLDNYKALCESQNIEYSDNLSGFFPAYHQPSRG